MNALEIFFGSADNIIDGIAVVSWNYRYWAFLNPPDSNQLAPRSLRIWFSSVDMGRGNFPPWRDYAGNFSRLLSQFISGPIGKISIFVYFNKKIRQWGLDWGLVSLNECSISFFRGKTVLKSLISYIKQRVITCWI